MKHFPIALTCLVVCLVVLSSVFTNGCQQSRNVTSTPTSGVTFESFEQISVGMSIEQVTAILGEPQDGIAASDGKSEMTLVGVDVSQLARWTDSTSDGRRQIEIGFTGEKVGAVVYRGGDVVEMKPEAPAGRFRLLAELDSSKRVMRVVVAVGGSQECLLTLGVGEAADQLKGLEAITAQETTNLTVGGQVVENADADGKALEIVLERLNPRTAATVEFAMGEDKTLSDALAFDLKSGVYELGEPVVVGIVSAQDTKTHKIILLVIEKQIRQDLD